MTESRIAEIEVIKFRVSRGRGLHNNECVLLIDEINRLEKALAETERKWREERGK